LFRLTLRKMIRKPGLMLCLFIGLFIAASLVSSIPVYTNASLERMLLRDLEAYQQNTGRFPGEFSLKIGLDRSVYGETGRDVFLYLDNKVKNEWVHQFKLPVLCGTTTLSVSHLAIGISSDANRHSYARLCAVSDIDRYTEIIAGRLYQDQSTTDTVEVIVTTKAMENLNLAMNETYTLQGVTQGQKPLRVTVVGVFTKKSDGNAWVKSDQDFDASFVMDFSLFHNLFENQFEWVDAGEWNYSLDYGKIKGSGLESIISANESHIRLLNQLSNTELRNGMIQTIEEYRMRKNQLLASFWMLITPVFIMLGVYIHMVSKMVIDLERNEIAVYKSRGGTRRQIVGMYALQGMVLGVLALILGPPCAYAFCRLLGASGGFLEFVGRKALPVELSPEACLYSGIVVLIFFFTILFPVISASRIDIVEHKKTLVNPEHPLWKKAFPDLACLALAAYGYFRYGNRNVPDGEALIEGAGAAIDPVLFLGSALFIVGMAILFLRIFPLLVRLLFIVGKEFWKPGLYASIIGLTRSGGQERFILLFMALTVAIGFFSANSARTINRNREDRIRHQTGADIRLFLRSPGDDDNAFLDGLPDDLPGIKAATRVFDSREIYPRGISIQSGSTTVPGITLMGIVPHEFAQVAWYRNGLLPHHLSDYLNLMQHSPKAVLVSSAFRDTWKYGKADLIYIPNGANEYIEGIIYDFIDYWPGIADPGKGFVVANLSYLQDMGLDKPVQVWLKKEAGAQDTSVFEKLNEKLEVERQEYADDLIRKARNDPKLQGTNGILTLSFIITILICMIGFSIYCVLSVKRRVLQFGILRAMGLNRADMASMALFELALVTGASIVAGFFIGHLAGHLYIPLIESVSSMSGHYSIPSVITRFRGDYIKIYIGIAAILAAGFAAVTRMVSRIRMTQALKLGED
jgi:putative ABC transport system permease protein